MKQRKYGFINEPKDTDFIFGAGKIPEEVLVPDGNWEPYLPIREFQAPYGFETYACVTFTLLTCLEAQIKRRYGVEENFSDRFLAIVSGTKNPGNSPQAVCEFLRKIGVVPEELWPYTKDINSWEKWSEKIPPKLYELAREFNAKWDFRYEQVPSNPEAISKALTMSMLMISVPAWSSRDGKYYRPQGMRDNHATSLFQERKGEFRRVFDSYDSPHIKDVEWGVVSEFVQRYWIKKREDVEKQKKTIWQLIMAFLGLKSLMEKEGITELMDKPVDKVDTSMGEKLHLEARKWLGKDASPSDLAPEDRACAESVSNIIGKVIDFPLITGTWTLWDKLKKDKRFKATLDPKPGNIIISPTGTGNGQIVGHTGIFTDNWIMSSDGIHGVWKENYTLDGWVRRYRQQGGFPVYFYELI